MNNRISTGSKWVSTVMLGAAMLISLSACGPNIDSSDSPGNSNQSSQSQQAGDNEIPSFEGKSLYEAIIFARENNLSYATRDQKGDAVKTENSREWNVVKQSPAAGETFKDRDKLELTVEESK